MSLLEQLNNREKALIIWILIFLVWIFARKDTRRFLPGVIKSFLHKKVLIVVGAMVLYVSLIVLLLYQIDLWRTSQTKNTVFWLLGTAFVLLVNTDKAGKDDHYFKTILYSSLTFAVIIQFIVNAYTFSLGVELILLPTAFIIISMGIVAGTEEKYKPAKKVIDVISGIFGVFLIFFALANIVRDHQRFTTSDNFLSFILPPLLTIVYIPFLYFMALLFAYETLFIHLNIRMKEDKALIKFTRQKILALCNLNLNKLNRFSKEYTRKFNKWSDRDNVITLISEFKSKEISNKQNHKAST